MTEQASSPEQEPQPRAVTGLFQLRVYGAPLEFSPDGKALPAGGEPRFVVKDVMVLHTKEGWAKFSKTLTAHLTGVESELFGTEGVGCVAEGPWPELTDSLEPGEIRIISQEEYDAAYYEKYGDVIQGPFIL